MAGVILATAASKSVEAISDALYGLFMQQERLDRIAKSMMIKGPLSLLGLTIGFALTHSVFWGVVGLTLGRAVVMVLYDFRNAHASLKLSRKANLEAVCVRTRAAPLECIDARETGLADFATWYRHDVDLLQSEYPPLSH